MAEIKRIVTDDGELRGFVLDGEVFELNETWSEPKALRSLANRLFNALLNIDTVSASEVNVCPHGLPADECETCILTADLMGGVKLDSETS